MHGLPVDAELLGHLVDRALARRQQHEHDVAHAIDRVRAVRARCALEHLPGISRHHRVSHRVPCVQVTGGADEPVEVLPEFDGVAEDAKVQARIGRRWVREAYPQRTPCGAEKELQVTEQDADDQLHRLPR
ncbi:hypothetical protein D3C72_1993180 [compost metagenome]